MRSLFISILAVFFLFAQLDLTLHTYENHKDGQICELCVSASQLSHALHSQTAYVTLDIAFGYTDNFANSGKTHNRQYFYTPRAPPIYL